MIRPLRRRHRAVWSLLAFALPLLLITSLRARPELSPAVEPPAELQRAWGVALPLGAGAVRVAGQEAEGWRARRIRGARPADSPAPEDRGASDAAPEGVEIELGDAPPEPDLLVYWLEGEAPGGELSEALAAAWLLGVAPLGVSRVYALPQPGLEGTLVLYSLAHQSVRGALTLPAGGD